MNCYLSLSLFFLLSLSFILLSFFVSLFHCLFPLFYFSLFYHYFRFLLFFMSFFLFPFLDFFFIHLLLFFLFFSFSFSLIFYLFLFLYIFILYISRKCQCCQRYVIFTSSSFWENISYGWMRNYRTLTTLPWQRRVRYSGKGGKESRIWKKTIIIITSDGIKRK